MNTYSNPSHMYIDKEHKYHIERHLYICIHVVQGLTEGLEAWDHLWVLPPCLTVAFCNLDRLDVSELGPYVYFLSKEAQSTLG